MMNELAPEPIPVKVRELLQALMARVDCAALVELIALRGQGWESDELDSHFIKQRTIADTDRSSQADIKWLHLMYKSLSQMDKQLQFVRTTRFIDLGCCPGGYTTYILEKCPLSTGVGISLPIEDGGHGTAIPPDLLPRLDLHMADLTTFDLAPSINKPHSPFAPLKPIPFECGTFDLAVCDGHSLRINPDNVSRPWNWNRLLISQMLIALKALSPGGTIFLKLSHPEKSVGARVLLALCRVANLVRTIKPKPLHAVRGTFYVIAQGVQTESEEYQELVDKLEWLWYIMTFEGENGYGRWMTWEDEDMITDWEQVMSERGLEMIARLGIQVWRTQRDALRKLFRARGIADEQGQDDGHPDDWRPDGWRPDGWQQDGWQQDGWHQGSWHQGGWRQDGWHQYGWRQDGRRPGGRRQDSWRQDSWRQDRDDWRH